MGFVLAKRWVTRILAGVPYGVVSVPTRRISYSPFFMLTARVSTSPEAVLT